MSSTGIARDFADRRPVIIAIVATIVYNTRTVEKGNTLRNSKEATDLAMRSSLLAHGFCVQFCTKFALMHFLATLRCLIT